jgi:predicted PurR-regulated permease PerM
MKTATDTPEELRNVALAIIALGVVVAGLVLGRSLLIPLAVAILLWNLLEAMIQGFARLQVGSYILPRWVATILGIATVGVGFYLVLSVLLGQVDAIAAAWPRYVSRFETIVSDLTQWLGPERAAKLKDAVAAIDVSGRVPRLIASTQSIVVSFLLVVAYIGFLFAERAHLRGKLVGMLPDARRAQKTSALFATISQSVQRYLWIKTVVSVATAVLCYAVLRWLGVDFAETWALLIFVLNYIPNIGSIVAVAFPALLALVQFETLGPFIILVISLTAIQLAIGSVLEPMLMGNTLNMSPLAIILGLAFWGTIWGIVGMFLSVPIMVVVMIVCAHVPSWRWVAILLSKDGQIPA